MAEKGWVDRMFYSLEPQFRVLVPFRNTGQIQVPKLICALHVSVAKGVKIELLFLWRGKLKILLDTVLFTGGTIGHLGTM